MPSVAKYRGKTLVANTSARITTKDLPCGSQAMASRTLESARTACRRIGKISLVVVDSPPPMVVLVVVVVACVDGVMQYSSVVGCTGGGTANPAAVAAARKAWR